MKEEKTEKKKRKETETNEMKKKTEEFLGGIINMA